MREVANLFDEKIEVEVCGESTEEAIERACGIPAALQILCGTAERPFLRLRSTGGPSAVAKSMPPEIAELGCSQERFDRYYAAHGDRAPRLLFPFLRPGLGRSQEFFGRISKAGLESQDEYVKHIREESRRAIVGSIEAYIDAFLRTPSRREKQAR